MLIFGVLGLAVPVVLLLWWHISPYGAGREAALWPSSILFMALDEPSPASISTVVVIYAAALFENFILYAVIGALIWPIAYFVLRLRRSLIGSAKSSG